MCTPSELVNGSNVAGCLNPYYPYPGFVVHINSSDAADWIDSSAEYVPTSLAYIIFNDTNVDIYTDLSGNAYIYIEKYNQTYPVVDGRIALLPLRT